MTPQLRLFGGAAIIGVDGRPIAGSAAQPRRLAVLALLADAHPSPVTRDRLVGLIWPDTDEASARRLLTQALYKLRRELGDVLVVSATDVAIDAQRLDVDLIELRRALATGDLDQAISLYRGPLLDGFHPRGAPEFERWSDGLRASVLRELRDALRARARELATAGETADAARLAERWVELDPLDGDAVLELATLWEGAGDSLAALRALDLHVERLRVELEIDASPSVRARIERLRGSMDAAPPARFTSHPQPKERVRGAAPEPVSPHLESRTGGSSVFATHRIRRVLPWLAAAGAVAFVWTTAVEARVNRRAEVSAPVVAVRALDVHGGGLADLRLGGVISSLLAPALDGSNGARVYATSPDSTTSNERATATLEGSLAVVGTSIRLDAHLRSVVSGEAIASASVTGPRDSALVLGDRLAARLMIGFYPELTVVSALPAAQRFERTEALRAYLDGEMAFRRGEFTEAHERFKAATTADSMQAWAWYRRAVAAEEAHRNVDADRSLARARASRQALTDRERRLFDGYARWRDGDEAEAERMFRRLAEEQASDREAWYQFAELTYHAGPLLGRSIDDAMDPWRRVLALDPGNVAALVHVARLEARRGETGSLDALESMRNAPWLGAVPAAEARVIAAFGSGDARRVARIERTIDSLPDYSLLFLHTMVAGMLERPADAVGIVERLTTPERTPAIRGEAHLALAHLAMAGGRWRDAWLELRRAEETDPVAAAWTRAYFATLPFLTLPDSIVREAAATLAAVPEASSTAPLYLRIAVNAPAAPVIRDYLSTLLASRSETSAGADDVAFLHCDQRDGVSGSTTHALCLDLRRGVAADQALRAGNAGQAAVELEAMTMRVPYQLAGRSIYLARTRERWLRAEALLRLGRNVEAARWFASLPMPSAYDYLYLVPARLRRAQIEEHHGDLALAAIDYQRVLDVCRNPDKELAWIRVEALAGLERLKQGSRTE